MVSYYRFHPWVKPVVCTADGSDVAETGFMMAENGCDGDADDFVPLADGSNASADGSDVAETGFMMAENGCDGDADDFVPLADGSDVPADGSDAAENFHFMNEALTIF